MWTPPSIAFILLSHTHVENEGDLTFGLQNIDRFYSGTPGNVVLGKIIVTCPCKQIVEYKISRFLTPLIRTVL
jgi:hypothetical protein